MISQFPYLQTVFSGELDYFEKGWWMALFGPFVLAVKSSSLHELFEGIVIGTVFVWFSTFLATAFLLLWPNASGSDQRVKRVGFIFGIFWGLIGILFAVVPD